MSHYEDGPCFYCQKPTESFAGDPAKWPTMLNCNKLVHIGCLNEKLAELERLRKVETTCKKIVDAIEPWLLQQAEQGRTGIMASEAVPLILAELERLRQTNRQAAADWAEDYTRLQRLVKQYVLGADAEGDEHGVPGIGDLLDIVGIELERLREVDSSVEGMKAGFLERLENLKRECEQAEQETEIFRRFDTESRAKAEELMKELQDVRDERDKLANNLAEINSDPGGYLAVGAFARRVSEAERERDEAIARLPEGMKECTILFKECEKGHGRLTAANWVDHGCHYCELERLRQEGVR